MYQSEPLLENHCEFDLLKHTPTSLIYRYCTHATSTRDIHQLSAGLARLNVRPSTAISFTKEQQQFIDLAVNKRRNLLLLAPAGYGKSEVIKSIVNGLRCNLRPVNGQPVVGLCAPTGQAASLIDGRTLHSFFGIRDDKEPAVKWIKTVYAGTKAALQGVQVVVVDEASMVDGRLLNKISEYLQHLRGNAEPFGGVQMILIGDLCQLPPVPVRDNASTYVFLSSEYERGDFQPFRFTRCFRQSDPDFLQVLNEVRLGGCTAQTLEYLRQRSQFGPNQAHGLTPVRLAATNSEIDGINERELDLLVSKDNVEAVAYPVRARNSAVEGKVTNYCGKANIQRDLKLAVGCPVVVTRNLGNGIANGTQGTVVQTGRDFIALRLDDGSIPTIEYTKCLDPEDKNVENLRVLFHYLPVRLAYAITVHKAQGMSLKLVEIDFKRFFAHGQAYTALSRVVHPDGVVVRNLEPKAIKCEAAVREFYESFPTPPQVAP